MWNMKHEEWCHKWCHMEKGYKHGKSYLNQGLRYIFRIIKAWRPCEWQKGINKIENKRIMRIKKRYSWIYLTGKWIPYRYIWSSFWQYKRLAASLTPHLPSSHLLVAGWLWMQQVWWRRCVQEAYSHCSCKWWYRAFHCVVLMICRSESVFSLRGFSPSFVSLGIIVLGPSYY